MDAKLAAGKRAGAKWRLRIAIAFAIYLIFGFFFLPVIIKAQLRTRLSAISKREVTIRQVRVNPLAFILTIRGLSLKEPNGDTFASFEEFKINFQPIASLFHWSLVFSEISLKDPFGQVIYGEDGTFNFANILAGLPPPPPTPPKPSEPPRLLVYRLSITNGGLAFSDLKHKEPFSTRFGPINVNLTNFTTIRNKNSPYSFIAFTDSGERFAWAGNVSANPPSSSGIFRLEGLKIGKYTPYARDYTRFDIASGTVAVDAGYRLDLTTNAMDLDVTNANVSLTDLVLSSPDTNETLISVPSFSLSDCEANLLHRTARIGQIKTSNGLLVVRREQDGSINLISLLKIPAPKPVQPGADAGPAWTARIDEIAVDNYALKVEDKKPERPASFNIDQIAVNLRGISTEPNVSITTSLSVRFQETGFASIKGSATIFPPSAELQIALTNIDLRPIQPYAHEEVRLAITSCGMNLNGTARFTPEKLGPPRGTFVGDVSFSKLGTTDDVLFKDFAKWDSLSVTGIKVEVMPEKLHVDRIKFDGISGSLVIGPDRRPNVLNILRKNVESAGASATNADNATRTAPATPMKLPDIDIGEIAFENGSIHFQDESLTPRCSFDVQEFGGSIQGISSKEGAHATIDLKGKVDDRSPFSMSGTISPLAKQVSADVTMTVTNAELSAFSPYTEKFAGHALQKGKFSMAVHYRVEDKALKAENSFYVDQLTLGPRNDSPDATKLPVKLAVALLKDRNGRIALDVPVSGRTDDPKFSVWPIVWHVVENLIVKAATSPFALLGAAFGGGGEELSYVEFVPGHSEMTDSEAKKLDTLSKALYERPELTLDITGSADPVTEREPLARLRLEERIKSAYVQELTDSGKPAVQLSEVKLEPKERERLLRKIYKKDIGRYKPTEPATNTITGAPSPLPTTPEPEVTSGEPTRGSAQLLQKEKPLVVPARLAQSAAATGKPVTAFTRKEIELADMEDQLVQRIEITNDDFRELMQQRANQVQSALVKTGKVDASRLITIAPKNIDASFRGVPRVNLSLN